MSSRRRGPDLKKPIGVSMAGDKTGGLLVPRIKEGCILSECLNLKDLESTPEKDVVEVSPCASERGKVVAEIDLSRGADRTFLEIEILCLLLESYKNRFSEMKCSPKLGVGRLMWKARRIYAYEKGKFKVRFAHSREDAIRTMDSIGRLILGSVNCEKCGCPAVGCVLDRCDVCVSDEPPRAIQLGDYFNGPLLLESLKFLDEALRKSRRLRQDFLVEEGEWPASLEREIRRKLKGAIEYSMNFCLETSNHKDSVIGVEIIALARESLHLLEHRRTLLENMVPELDEKDKKLASSLYKNVWKVNENLARALAGGNREKMKMAEKRISKSLEIFSEVNTSLNEREWEDNFREVVELLGERIHANKHFLEKVKA